MPLPVIEPPPLSLSLAGLSVPDRAAGVGESVREQIAFAASSGFRAVQLNLGPGGLKPREFGRSARRDLAALLRRQELHFSGADLWIPPKHYATAAMSDRALAAAAGAIEFVAELAPLAGSRAAALSLELPTDDAAGSVRSALAAAAASAGVAIADHAWPPFERAPSPIASIGIGLDPAAILLAGALARDTDEWLRDPALAASRLGPRIASARLSDLGLPGRVPPGEGRLDELAYLVALATAGYAGCLVLDLRGIAQPERAARDTAARLAPTV